MQCGQRLVILIVNEVVDVLVALQGCCPDDLSDLRRLIQQLILNVKIARVRHAVPQCGQLFIGCVDPVRQGRHFVLQLLQTGCHIVDLANDLLLQKGGIFGSAPPAQLIFQICKAFINGIQYRYRIGGGAVGNIRAGADGAAGGVGGIYQYAAHIVHGDGRSR